MGNGLRNSHVDTPQEAMEVIGQIKKRRDSLCLKKRRDGHLRLYQKVRGF